VYRLTILVQPRAPCVIPQAAPVRLLFITNQLGDFGAFFLGCLKGAKLCKTARADTNNSYSNRDKFLPGYGALLSLEQTTKHRSIN
jgi:hypothetical protein